MRLECSFCDVCSDDCRRGGDPLERQKQGNRVVTLLLLLCYPHRRSTTVSSETFTLYLITSYVIRNTKKQRITMAKNSEETRLETPKKKKQHKTNQNTTRMKNLLTYDSKVQMYARAYSEPGLAN